MYKWENKNKFIVFLNLFKIDLYSKKVKNEQVESRIFYLSIGSFNIHSAMLLKSSLNWCVIM